MDGYDILEQLGEGSSGEAFLVRSKKNGAKHVLKRIRTDYLSSMEKESAEREAIVLKSLDHPNVTKFEGSFISAEDGSVNILMEACEMTLEDLMDAMREDQAEALAAAATAAGASAPRGGPSSATAASSAAGSSSGVGLPEHVLLEWMAELASALQYLHSKRILHRDIKPSNVFVSKTYHLKIGDFGVSKVLSRKSMVANSMVGTPLYIAPEVLIDEPYDERSDVWSLGVLFFELCTLQRPFSGDNFLSIVREITTKEPGRVSRIRPKLDARFDEVIQPMLVKDPRKRVKSDDVLRHFVVQQNHPSHPSQKPSRSRVCQDAYKVELTLPKSLHSNLRDRSSSGSPPFFGAAAPTVEDGARKNKSPPTADEAAIAAADSRSLSAGPAALQSPTHQGSTAKPAVAQGATPLGPKPQQSSSLLHKPTSPASSASTAAAAAASARQTPTSAANPKDVREKPAAARRGSIPQASAAIPGPAAAAAAAHAAAGAGSMDEHTRRVRQARSKINMQELRQKWSASQTGQSNSGRFGMGEEGTAGGDGAGGVQVLVPRHPQSPEMLMPAASNRQLQHLGAGLHADPVPIRGRDEEDSDGSMRRDRSFDESGARDDESAAPPPHAPAHVSPSPQKPRGGSSVGPESGGSGGAVVTLTAADGSLTTLMIDLLRQMDKPGLTLEEVDEAGMALLEFKKRRFGTY